MQNTYLKNQGLIKTILKKFLLDHSFNASDLASYGHWGNPNGLEIIHVSVYDNGENSHALISFIGDSISDLEESLELRDKCGENGLELKLAEYNDDERTLFIERVSGGVTHNFFEDDFTQELISILSNKKGEEVPYGLEIEFDRSLGLTEEEAIKKAVDILGKDVYSLTREDMIKLIEQGFGWSMEIYTFLNDIYEKEFGSKSELDRIPF